jgi:nicotinamide-nucleotide amidase
MATPHPDEQATPIVETPGGPTVEETAALVVRLLAEQGTTVAVAESLTGGLVVSSLVGVPGASQVVRGGVVAYMTDLKASLLGVDPDLLARVGAVDRDVALAMARGVGIRLGADYGVATTGVAGPDPQDGRPVGEIWIAVWTRATDTAVATDLHLDPTLGRAAIRAIATAEALTHLATAVSDL